MAEIAALIEELKAIHNGNAWHGPSLHEALQGISGAQSMEHPISGVHSVQKLVLHIFAWERIFIQRLEGIAMAEPEEGDFPDEVGADEEAWSRIKSQADQIHQQLIEKISALSEERLDEIVAGKDYSVRHLLHGIVRHHVYHAGQISLLRKKLIL